MIISCEDFGNHADFKIEVEFSDKELLDMVQHYLDRSPNLWGKAVGHTEQQGSLLLSEDFHISLLEWHEHPMAERIASRLGGDKEDVYCRTRVCVRVVGPGNRFLVVSWKRDFPDRGIIFGVRNGENYDIIPIPPGIEVGLDGTEGSRHVGKMTLTHEGKKYTFGQGHKLWPEALLNPRRAAAICRLEELLAPGDHNPLTALLRSPQPVKAHAAQIKNTLQEVFELL